MSFRSESVTFHGRVRVALPADEAFPLFSPVGEKEWVPGWEPELLHPAGVEWAQDQVFRTRDAAGEAVWFVARLDHAARSVAYHRVDLGVSATSVAVTCRSVDDASSVAEVTYRFVGITDEGNAHVRQQSQEAFDRKFAGWEERIAAAIARR